MEKDPVSMTCLATGSPNPEIQWFRRGIQIQEDHKGVELFPSDGRMVILSVKSTDHGPYICKAINPAGEVNQDILLTVIGEESGKFEMILIIRLLKDFTVSSTF